jgi:hypothetical protein
MTTMMNVCGLVIQCVDTYSERWEALYYMEDLIYGSLTGLIGGNYVFKP